MRKDSEIRTFNERGIAALHSLLKSEPTLLDGAEIADTIVGKGAAALMVKGGVKSLYAEVISQSGLKLLQQAHVTVCYRTLVSHIENRSKTDWCPVEKLCKDEENIDRLMEKIDQFIEQLKMTNR